MATCRDAVDIFSAWKEAKTNAEFFQEICGKVRQLTEKVRKLGGELEDRKGSNIQWALSAQLDIMSTEITTQVHVGALGPIHFGQLGAVKSPRQNSALLGCSAEEM